MTEAQKIAEWLYANKDKQDSPEFQQKLARFREVDKPEASQPSKPMNVPPRGQDSVRILQDEFVKEYERVPQNAEDQARKEGNLAALTRELATLNAKPPEVAPQVNPQENNLEQDLAKIEQNAAQQQPSDQRLNAQVMGAVAGAVPGVIQQASVIKDAGKRGLAAAIEAVADRNRGPSTVADLASDVISGELPQGVTQSNVNQAATRFYQQNPHELENGMRAAGGRGTYAYARSFQLPVELSMQAVDLKDAQRLVQERRAGTLAAQAAFPSETLVERPTSGVLTLGERREPRARLIIGGDIAGDQEPPPQQPRQPRVNLPPASPLTGAPQPRLTAGSSPFQPGVSALLQRPPAEVPVPSMTAGAPPLGVATRREPILGQTPVEAPVTAAARPAVRSGLDAVTGMFARNVTEPVQRVLSSLPIVPKTLGGMQIGGGGAEMATGMKQGDAGKVGTGAAEMLGGGLSMFGRTAPAGMAVSILTELYRNARTPEDRQKILSTLDQMMFGRRETM